MGYNTIALIKNDAIRHIEKNPEELISNIKKGLNPCNLDIIDYKIGGYCSAISIAPSVHADVPMLYLIGTYKLNPIGKTVNNINIEERKRNLKIAEDILNKERNLIEQLEINNRKEL